MSKQQPAPTANEQQALNQYRELLLNAEEKAQSEYDKLIVALSGGALGVSFAFVHQFLDNRQPQRVSYLLAAWILWIVSLASILASHYFSVHAMRKAITQLDGKRIRKEKAGGLFDDFVKWLNAGAGISFIAGAVMVIIFAFLNLR